MFLFLIYCNATYLSDQSVLGLKLFSIVHGVINQSESSRLATSKVSFETKSKDSVGSAAVKLSKLLPDVGLADGGFSRMENIDHHLTSAQETVQHVLACANGDTSVNGHGDFF